MIWLWIITTLILSYLPLVNKKIELANYMWLLLPFDTYGISIAAATVRPYMIFALLLPIILYAKNRNGSFEFTASKGQLLAGIISILIILVNMINCNDLSAAKAAVMTFAVYLCAQFYVSSTNSESQEQLCDVFVASCFGCGIVYIVAYLLLINGIDIDGIVANTRYDDGIFMSLPTMSQGKFINVYRLRGFISDPNAMFVPFIFGISVCVSRLTKKFSFYHTLTLVLSVICTLLSSSRMGLLCCIACILITLLVAISQIDSIKKKILSVISTLAVSVGLSIFAVTSYGQQLLNSLISTYSNRSSLTDEYGRFSIWKECLRVYWNEKPILGVGLGEMSKYTAIERMTHNTFLQFICECGFIVGSIAIIYFLSIMIISWIKINKHKGQNAYIALVIGYTMTLVSLVSVDNVTCSYMWFAALLLLKLMNYTPTKQTLK